MKAILTYTTMINGEQVEQTRLFNTAKAKKICDFINDYGNKTQEIKITDKGVIFLYKTVGKGKIEVVDQKQVKEWIGEHEPDKYIKFFGKVEEG